MKVERVFIAFMEAVEDFLKITSGVGDADIPGKLLICFKELEDKEKLSFYDLFKYLEKNQEKELGLDEPEQKPNDFSFEDYDFDDEKTINYITCIGTEITLVFKDGRSTVSIKGISRSVNGLLMNIDSKLYQLVKGRNMDSELTMLINFTKSVFDDLEANGLPEKIWGGRYSKIDQGINKFGEEQLMIIFGCQVNFYEDLESAKQGFLEMLKYFYKSLTIKEEEINILQSLLKDKVNFLRQK